jgi:magnesium-transporting ATPase (P-type)
MWPFTKEEEKQDINKAIGFGVLGGLGQVLYCTLVVSFFNAAEKIFPPLVGSQLTGALFMLILFVFSVGTTGLIVFGYPAYLAFQKQFKPAILAAVSALVTLIAIGILILFMSFLV